MIVLLLAMGALCIVLAILRIVLALRDQKLTSWIGVFMPTALAGLAFLVAYSEVALRVPPSTVAVAKDGSVVAGPTSVRDSWWKKPDLLVVRKDQVYMRYADRGNEQLAIVVRYRLGTTFEGKELYRILNPAGQLAYAQSHVDALIDRGLSTVPQGEPVTSERLTKAIGTEIDELKRHGLEISIRDVTAFGK